MSNDIPTHSGHELMTIAEHEVAVEHYEKQCNLLQDTIDAQSKLIANLRMQIAILEQLKNKVGAL